MPRRSTISRLSTAAIAAGAIVASVLIAPPAYAATVTNTIAEVQGTGASRSDGASPRPDSVTVEGVVTGDHRTGGYRGFYMQTAGTGHRRTPAPPTASSSSSQQHAVDRHRHRRPGPGHRAGRASSTAVTQITATAAGAVEARQAGAGADPADRAARHRARHAPRGLRGHAGAADRHVQARLQPQPAELRRAVAERRRDDARRGDRDGGARHQGRDRHRDRQQQRAPASLDDGYSIRGRQRGPRRRPAVLHQGHRRPQRRQRGLPGRRLRARATASTTGACSRRRRSRRERRRTSSRPSRTANPRPAAPPEVGGDITVAAFNVLNYFTTLTSQNPDARGAATAEQFAIQKSKIVTAINGLDADVVALQEIENSVKLGETAGRGARRPGRRPQRRGRRGHVGLRPHARRAAQRRDHRLHHERDHLQARRGQARRARR